MGALWLNSNRLSGSIPTQLGALFALTTLALSSNQLTATLPTELGLLSNLDSSYPILLGNNSLSGVVPGELCQLKRANAFELRIDCDDVECNCSCSCAETAANDDA
jgi:hypothetical protein